MRQPDLRRVLGNIEVNDLPSEVAEDDHGVEQPKTSRSQQRTCRWPPCRPCGCAESCARSGRGLRVAMACICRRWLGSGIVTSPGRLRFLWAPGSQQDEENQLQRLPIPARDHSAGDL